jgi:hypothetical protein
MAAQTHAFQDGIQIIPQATALLRALWVYSPTIQLAVAFQNAHRPPTSLAIKKFVTSLVQIILFSLKTTLVNVYRFVLMVALLINIIVDVWMCVH